MFRFDDPDDHRRVRAVFDAVGYTDEGIVRTLGTNQEALGEKRLRVLLHRTRGGTPLETMIRLFILGGTVPIEESRRAFEPMSPERWAELGLIETDGGQVRATVQMRCYQGLIVAYDFVRRARDGLRRDHVMGISPSSLALAGLTPRTPSRSTLDLGTGSGFQALLASSHSQQVVATDLNPRAIDMAALNVGLNSSRNVECLQGDMLEPVAGRAFDLIVSNPPFIIAPDRTHLFLHSGLGGDEVCRAIARRAPEHLAEGGICQFQANWVLHRDEEAEDRLRAWFEGSGCDALVLHREDQPLEEYAELWIETQAHDQEGFDRAFERWMGYYEDEGIEAIGSGVITMRRRTGDAGWFRLSQFPDAMSFPCGDDVLRALDAVDFLERHPQDRSLLESHLRISPDVRLERSYRSGAEGWEVEFERIRRTNGLQYEGSIDAEGARILAACDGRRPLIEVLGGIVGETEPPQNRVVPEALPIIRRLIEQGFLLPGNGERSP